MEQLSSKLQSAHPEESTLSTSKIRAFRFDENLTTDRQDDSESLNQIKSQQIKIRQLTDENSQLNEQIERLKLQLGQIEVYKNQAQNMKKQVQACEEKIKFYDAENARRESSAEDQINLLSAKESQFMQEIERKNEIIDRLEKRLEAETAKTNEILKETENSQQENQKMAGQIAELNGRIDELTAEIDARQYSFAEERGLLEKNIRELELEKGRTEGKMHELNEMLQLQQIELDKKDAIMKDLEATQKQLADELEKCHSHIEAQNRYIQELKDENKYIPQLSSKIKECTKRIEQISAEVDKEKQKSGKLAKVNANLEKKIEDMKFQYSGENSPEYLRKQIDSHKEYVEELELAKANLQIRIKEFQAEIKEWEVRFEEEGEAVTEGLRFLLGFLEASFTDIKGGSVEQDLEEPERKPKNRAISFCLTELKKAIKGIKAGIAKSWELLEKENVEAKKELIETRTVKDDIMNEIARFKGLLEDQECNIKEREDENFALAEERERLKEELQQEREQNEENAKEIEELEKEVYAGLFSVMAKYEGVDFVTSRVNLKPNVDMTKDRKGALMELVSILADVTNVLNFEIKGLNIKILDLGEEKRKLEIVQNETVVEAQRLEQLYTDEKKQLEDAFDTKQQQFELLTTNYEKHNSMLAKEIEQCKVELKKQEEAFKTSALKNAESAEKTAKLQKACEVYLRTLLSLARKVEDLSEQKTLAQKELKTFVALSNTTQGQLNTLGVIAEEEAKMEIELQTLKPSLLRTTTTEGEQLATELQKHKKYVHALRFRKAAIAVIAANRLLKRRGKRYGTPLAKYGSVSQFLADSLLQTTVPESTSTVISRLNNLLPYIGILPSNQFPEGALSNVAMKIATGLPKLSNAAEESKLVVQTLDELYRLEAASKKDKEATLLSHKSKRYGMHTATMLDFLQEGLSGIKSKYSWLHLGIPLELFSNDIKYIDSLFYKDLMSQEDAKKIEKALAQLKLIPQLKGQLELCKEREDALVKQLTGMQAECKEYEENIKKLMSTIDELQIKEATMVTADAYEEATRVAELREREVEGLANDLDNMKAALEESRDELERMTQRLRNAEGAMADTRKRLVEANEDIELKQHQVKDLENELNTREAELVRNLQIQQKYEDDKAKLYTENRKLEAELETLKRDLEFVEKEMGEIKYDNEALKEEVKKYRQLVEEAKSKEELLEFYKEKANKYDEIVKLQELNLINVEKKCDTLEGTIRELSKENALLKDTQNSSKLKERYYESTLGMDSKFQSERAGVLLQLPPAAQTPHRAKENASGRRDMIYDVPLGEMPKKPESGASKLGQPAQSVYNIDLERYNQMMRAGGRVPGMIIKK